MSEQWEFSFIGNKSSGYCLIIKLSNRRHARINQHTPAMLSNISVVAHAAGMAVFTKQILFAELNHKNNKIPCLNPQRRQTLSDAPRSQQPPASFHAHGAKIDADDLSHLVVSRAPFNLWLIWINIWINEMEMQRRMQTDETQRGFKGVRDVQWENWKAARCRLSYCKMFCLHVFAAFHISYISPSVSLLDVCGWQL